MNCQYVPALATANQYYCNIHPTLLTEIARELDGDDKGKVEISVKDTGCGMNAEVKNKLFQSFFSTKGTEGTGIGLMITKKIIDEHEGIIAFESEPGKGTKFVFKLPERDQSPEVDCD